MSDSHCNTIAGLRPVTYKKETPTQVLSSEFFSSGLCVARMFL